MRLSERISAVSPSPTVTLNSLAKKLENEGIKVINLSVGEPDFSTPEAIVNECIEALKKGRMKYGPAGGGLALRRAIQEKLLRENNYQISADQIVVGIGAKEILFHLALAILNDGDEVMIPAPYWVSYPAHCQAAGANPVEIPMIDGAYFPNPETIEKFATDKTKAIILNSPNNPGGYVLSREQLTQLGRYIRDKPWYIISDEIYEYLSFDGPHISLISLFPELADRYIHVNGFSKGFAMTGWRVGYAAGPAPVMKLLRNIQSQSSTCLPPFIEDAACFAIKQGPALMVDQIADLKRRRDFVIGLVDEMLVPLGVRYIFPKGAFYVFLDCSNVSTLNQSTIQLSERLLEIHHVAMVPGEAFGCPDNLRMSFTTSDASLREGIRRLAIALAGES